jgi:hypothetical protein
LTPPEQPRTAWFTLGGIAFCVLLLHAFTNGRYGFHRDELATLDDARRLAWGYVAYPPLTPFVGRVALALFGPWLAGIRLFASLAQAGVIILTGLMACELGGRRTAQTVAALAAAISPISLGAGALFQYVSFDFLWWVLTAYLTVRLLKSGNPRWWLAIGAAIGAGMLTKYTALFWASGLAGGVLLTGARRYLRNPWLWSGVAVAVLIFLPNLLWQAGHGFVSLEFLRAIHARDVRIGRTDHFLVEQFYVAASTVAVPLFLAGLWWLFFGAGDRRYRVIGWMFVIPFALFVAARGRGYYMAPAYPMLYAAGAIVLERWLERMRAERARAARVAVGVAIAAGFTLGAALVIPLSPVNSRWWRAAAAVNNDFREEIGWEELVATVSGIYNSLAPGERARTAIFVANYGEVGAIGLYGPAHGLPPAISGINSYWARGYGEPPPETLIVLGFPRGFLDLNFEACEVAGRITNRYGVSNEETDRPDVFLCRHLRRPWPEFWKRLRYFG